MEDRRSQDSQVDILCIHILRGVLFRMYERNIYASPENCPISLVQITGYLDIACTYCTMNGKALIYMRGNEVIKATSNTRHNFRRRDRFFGL